MIASVSDERRRSDDDPHSGRQVALHKQSNEISHGLASTRTDSKLFCGFLQWQAITGKQLRQEIPPTWFIDQKTSHDTSENLQDFQWTTAVTKSHYNVCTPTGSLYLSLRGRHKDKIHQCFCARFWILSNNTDNEIHSSRKERNTERWWREKIVRLTAAEVWDDENIKGILDFYCNQTRDLFPFNFYHKNLKIDC